jgi:hypothetical protein
MRRGLEMGILEAGKRRVGHWPRLLRMPFANGAWSLKAGSAGQPPAKTETWAGITATEGT